MLQEKARRMHKIRKERGKAKARGKKPSTIPKDFFDQKAEDFINQVMRQDEPKGYCATFSLGARTCSPSSRESSHSRRPTLCF